MAVALCYFSGTGNTELVSRILARRLGELRVEARLHAIPDLLWSGSRKETLECCRRLTENHRTLGPLPLLLYTKPTLRIMRV